MLNLMKLEMKRMNFHTIAVCFLSINAGILGILLLLGVDPEITAEDFNNAEQIMILIKTLVVAAFVIYASVLLSNMVIEEFKSKTITVLFTTPVSRKKLLLAKVLVISLLTFVMFLVSISVLTAIFSVLNNAFGILWFSFPIDILRENMMHLFVTGIAVAGMSLIPLVFGMRKYSVPATITSSILIVSVLSSSVNNGMMNLFSYTAIPIVLGIIGFIIAYLVINKAVKNDF
ncbi:ABC-2 family transporter protein [Terribacillus halophilus]|uniref:ABC-2 family transporter protein n=1 Tax=Terribacillus halophilus TaxID=361279 RepID=A0A1G6L0Q5_9BACI|nr:ABC transporter permease [Terribacillus halophilus]SDC36658.1 ABC-2 family transporter protein [Terribacillus halophilus]